MNPSPTEIYTLSLHDALPIFPHLQPIATGDLLQFKAAALAGLFEQGQHVLHYMAGWPLPFVEQLPQLLQRQWFTRCQQGCFGNAANSFQMFFIHGVRISFSWPPGRAREWGPEPPPAQSQSTVP